MIYLVIYRDAPETRAMLSTTHRILERAQEAKARCEQDPYWHAYVWELWQVDVKPNDRHDLYIGFDEWLAEHGEKLEMARSG